MRRLRSLLGEKKRSAIKSRQRRRMLFESLQKRELFDAQGLLLNETFESFDSPHTTLDAGWYGAGLAIEKNGDLNGHAIDGQRSTGDPGFQSTHTNLSIDASQRFLVGSFDAFADRAAKSHNSGVGLNGASWWYNHHLDRWTFYANGATGNSSDRFGVLGGADTQVQLHVVLDRQLGEIYGIADVGDSRVFETERYDVPESRLDAINHVFVTQDFRYEGWSGIDVGSIEVHQGETIPDSVPVDPVRYTNDGGTLFIQGSHEGDDVTVESSGKSLFITTGVSSRRITAESITDLVFEGLGGDDQFSNNTNLPSVLRGGIGDDTLVGGSAADLIVGGRGDDTIEGRGGDDTIYGDKETTRESGGLSAIHHSGDDTIRGGDGNDVIYAGHDYDFVDGQAGDDTIYGGIRNDVIVGGPGADTIHGQHGWDSVFGDLHTTYSSGGLSAELADTSADIIYGGLGNDNFWGGLGDDELFGGEGGDRISGGDGNDKLVGNGGEDVIFGDDGHDYILGDNGIGDQGASDTISGGRGYDKIYADGGDDRVYGEWSGAVEGDYGSVVIQGGQGVDEARDGDIIYGSDGQDTIYGNGGNDKIHGGIDGDWIYGGEGNDFIRGWWGKDTIYGNDGKDRIYGDDGWGRIGSADTIYGNDGNDEIFGDGGNDYILGGNGNDRLHGAAGNDVIRGHSGKDTIWGDDGDDNIYGDHGQGDRGEADTIKGGLGYDVIYGDGGDDTIYGEWGDGKSGADGPRDVTNRKARLERRTGDIIYGSDGNDIIYGDGADDQIHGGNGDDQLFGGEGDDTVKGWWGKDWILGGPGDDVLRGDTGWGHLGNRDYIDGGSGVDYVLGEGDNDFLRGGDGRDWIYGADGDDIIDGTFDDHAFDGGRGWNTINDLVKAHFDPTATNVWYTLHSDRNRWLRINGERKWRDIVEFGFTDHGHLVTLHEQLGLHIRQPDPDAPEKSGWVFLAPPERVDSISEAFANPKTIGRYTLYPNINNLFNNGGAWQGNTRDFAVDSKGQVWWLGTSGRLQERVDGTWVDKADHVAFVDYDEVLESIMYVHTATLSPNGVLRVLGSNDSDRLVVRQHNGTDLYVEGVDIYTYDGNRHSAVRKTDVEQIEIYGFDGDDLILVDYRIGIPALLVGGAGKDSIDTGHGTTVSIGGSGDDTILSRSRFGIVHDGPGYDRVQKNIGYPNLIVDGDPEDPNYVDDPDETPYGAVDGRSSWAGGSIYVDIGIPAGTGPGSFIPPSSPTLPVFAGQSSSTGFPEFVKAVNASQRKIAAANETVSRSLGVVTSDQTPKAIRLVDELNNLRIEADPIAHAELLVEKATRLYDEGKGYGLSLPKPPELDINSTYQHEIMDEALRSAAEIAKWIGTHEPEVVSMRNANPDSPGNDAPSTESFLTWAKDLADDILETPHRLKEAFDDWVDARREELRTRWKEIFWFLHFIRK